ncbi:MAG: signal peptidase II [Asticcacaulis sp.]
MRDLIELVQPYMKARATRLGMLCLLVTFAVLAADQASKAWVLYGLHLPLYGQVKILPFFAITMVRNGSMSFGLLPTGDWTRWLLALFQWVAGALLMFGATRARQWLPGVALAMIAGGAIGNGIDRIRVGSVVDFLDFSGLFFPWVFNIADSAICIGVACLAWHVFRSETDTAPQGN